MIELRDIEKYHTSGSLKTHVLRHIVHLLDGKVEREELPAQA